VEIDNDSAGREDDSEEGEYDVRSALEQRYIDITDDEVAFYVDITDAMGDDNELILTTEYTGGFLRHNLRRLAPKRYLSCDLINQYFSWLKSARPHYAYYSTYFAAKLNEDDMYDYAKVARFNSPRLRITTCEIFESLKWFIPINIGNSHWVLLVVYMQDKKIEYYDSIYDPITGKE